MATKPWAMGLIVLCTLLTSTAQLFYKWGAEKLAFDIVSLITNYELIIGLGIYVVGGTLMIISFRGGEVSTLYPIFATSYIWVAFLSIIYLGETATFLKWVGVITIVTGIAFIGFSSKDAGVPV